MIRNANLNDASKILNLLLSYSNNAHIDKEYIKKDMMKDYSNYIVYENENKVIGIINYQKFDSYAEIIDIVVDSEYRRKHIGSNLLEYAINILKSCDITLEVRESNSNAIKLYEKFGFKIIGIREKYYKEENAYIMKKAGD